MFLDYNSIYFIRDFFCDATDAVPPFKTEENEK